MNSDFAWAIAIGSTILFLYIPTAFIVTKLLRSAQSAGFRKFGRIACLTFDDGPDPVSTPEILDVLRVQRVHATFFVLGSNALKHPEIIADIAKDGHEIGEHGYSHLHPWKSLPWVYNRDLVAGNKAISRLLASDVHSLYRPTFGKANALTFAFAWLSGKSFAFWNVDPHDYSARHESEIVASFLDQISKTRGAVVVLLHDGRTPNWRGSAAKTAVALDDICKILHREGYQFKTVSELILTRRGGSQGE